MASVASGCAVKAFSSLSGAAESRCSGRASSPCSTPGSFSVNLRRSSRLRTAAVAAEIGKCGPASSSSVGSYVPTRFDLSRISIPIDIDPIEETVDGVENDADLDYWIRYSIAEIVRHIGKAPLLVHIYNDGVGGECGSRTCGLQLVTENAVADDWPLVRRRWGPGTRNAPEGIILVEELESDDGTASAHNEEASPSSGDIIPSTKKSNGQSPCSATKIWGILIQGRRRESGACYILKTCRVASSMGYCTHYCLAKADSLAGSAESQLKKVWLQRRAEDGDGSWA